jgi:ribulose-5-phosphate 4-epimerase/fuculose-1-phosphate aldolase
MDEVLQPKIDLVVALRMSERLGYNEGRDNHFSCLVPGTEEHFYINPHRMH